MRFPSVVVLMRAACSMTAARDSRRASCDRRRARGAEFSFQCAIEQLVVRARRVAAALVEGARTAVGLMQLQLQPHAALLPQPGLSGGQQCRAETARASLRQHEELVDLAHDTLVL